MAVVALIVAILTAAATGYLWYQGQQRFASLDSSIKTVEKSLQNNVQKVVKPKLGEMNDRLGEFSQRIDNLSQAQRKQQVGQLQQAIKRVQTRNTQLSDQLGGNHQRFVEQRIELLLDAANQRLLVERDPQSAIKALSLADQAIQKSGSPGLHTVRERIASEIAALKALPNPDLEGLSLKLSNTIKQIPKLALKSNVPNSYQPRAQGGSDAADDDRQGGDSFEFAGIKLAKKWHQFVDSIGRSLSQMVTIRRANGTQEAPALMAPDQSYFLIENLQLQLRTARLALLNRNGQTYHDALSSARDWVRKYFDTGDSGVAAVLDDLSQLSRVKLEWQAPDLSGSLKALRQIMARDEESGDSQSSASGTKDSSGNAPVNAPRKDAEDADTAGGS